MDETSNGRSEETVVGNMMEMEGLPGDVVASLVRVGCLVLVVLVGVSSSSSPRMGVSSSSLMMAVFWGRGSCERQQGRGISGKKAL